KVERLVRYRGRQDSAGSATRQIPLEAVAIRHAAAIFLDQFARRDAGRRQHHAGLLDAAGHRERTKALALASTIAGEPRRALLDDVSDPVERLDILFERRAAEQPDLRDVRRT